MFSLEIHSKLLPVLHLNVILRPKAFPLNTDDMKSLNLITLEKINLRRVPVPTFAFDAIAAVLIFFGRFLL